MLRAGCCGTRHYAAATLRGGSHSSNRSSRWAGYRALRFRDGAAANPPRVRARALHGQTASRSPTPGRRAVGISLDSRAKPARRARRASALADLRLLDAVMRERVVQRPSFEPVRGSFAAKGERVARTPRRCTALADAAQTTGWAMWLSINPLRARCANRLWDRCSAGVSSNERDFGAGAAAVPTPIRRD